MNAKLTSICIILALFFSLSITSAEAARELAKPPQHIYPIYPPQQTRNQRDVIRHKRSQIRTNRTHVRQLKQEVKDKIVVLQQKIAALRQDPTRLTPECIASLREGITLLTNNKKLINSANTIQKHQAKFQAHIRAGNKKAAIADLNNIINVQRNQIKHLRATTTALDNLITHF